MSRNLTKKYCIPRAFCLFALLAFAGSALRAQDWVHIESNVGATKIRIAAAEFKPGNTDAKTMPMKYVFDQTLYNDLRYAGVFDVVSKSMIPTAEPGTPQEINLATWAAAPSSAAYVAFGSITVNGGQESVQGFLYDTHAQQNAQLLGKQFSDVASVEATRMIAHRFADEIVQQLTGIAGIAETKIYYVSDRSGHREIWSMDYDGFNQHQLTYLHTISLGPVVSPDNSRVAFSSLGRDGWSIRMYSLVLKRMVSFPMWGNMAQSPAWSSDGNQLAFSWARTGNPDIYVSSSSGTNPHRITAFLGPNVSPAWNPKTNAQIAWVSGRTKLPQIYIMDTDGSNVMRLTDGGYATSPSWSPNGQLMTFAWQRNYGPGAPGAEDIYVMDVASRKWTQLTHDAGANDFPSWSPDNRHIVFQRQQNGHTEIWMMLADGTDQQQLTQDGNNLMPDWSWK
jgi:TolB protein